MAFFGVSVVNLYGSFLRQRYNFKHIFDIDDVSFFVAEDKFTRDEFFTDTIAFAIGSCVYAPSRRALTPAVIAHEMKHVEQLKEHGIFFPLFYLTQSLTKGYHRNSFEVAARRAERRPRRFRRVRVK